MSMWELEAFTEHLVRSVGATDLPRAQKRDLYANAFALVAGFDVSFTHFRTVELLVDAAFFHRIDVADYPAPDGRLDALQRLVSAGKPAWLMVDGEVDAYFTPARDDVGASLWFDSTMTLWRASVQAGLLQGLAAEAPEILPPGQAIPRFIAVLAAQAQPDLSALKGLHGVVAYVNDGSFDATDPAWLTARDTPALARALRTEHEEWIDERFDARQALPYIDGPAGAFLAWWCEVYEASSA